MNLQAWISGPIHGAKQFSLISANEDGRKILLTLKIVVQLLIFLISNFTLASVSINIIDYMHEIFLRCSFYKR